MDPLRNHGSPDDALLSVPIAEEASDAAFWFLLVRGGTQAALPRETRMSSSSTQETGNDQ